MAKDKKKKRREIGMQSKRKNKGFVENTTKYENLDKGEKEVI